MSRSIELIGGVQVSVETGTALVAALDPRPRNVGVTLDDPVLRGTLRRPYVGWLDRSDAEGLALAEAVVGTDTMVRYRIEVHRDAAVDPALPMAEVPQTARFRRLVSLVPATGDQAVVSETGCAGATGRTPAPDTDRAAPPVASGFATIPDGRETGSRATGRPGPRVQEAKPWEAANSDGSPNLGSFAVQAAVGMTELAHELMLARAAEAGHQVFSLDTMRRLARTLLVAADRVQAAVRADGHADRMDNSHARARGAVRTALEAHPVPWEGSAEEKAAWVEDLVGWATDILGCALELAQTPPVRVITRTAPVQIPESGSLANDAERQGALAATRRIGDTAQRERLEQFMRAHEIPPLISPALTSEQALKVRAYLANVDGSVAGAA